ncbi:Ornithine cyclodeaminase/mu-crystallin family protein [Aspergillus parasiticus SU-1]|uniref:Ornithine cyclodeaminase/mu-crystallin family protein n=1 Tax=Aspergillus parasiticus (strain ATCC 56775 / NRRL 5862 / SRRC 143 / SU-1) TaxID=1403190 RepID=A0A0F0IHF0_ASPPU|nr:Ornithine cyclodeaminase/mu-crystallin family protein [Aspergillus parasiticus SU-1]
MAEMSEIRILDNSTIHGLLINLSKAETIQFRQVVERTFEDFSVNGERQYQPMPSVANRPNGQNTLFRPFTSNTGTGTKITVEPAPGPDGKKDPLHGVIVLCDGKGNPKGLLSSEEVTGYRTSMNVMVPFSWRKHVGDIIIFGSGMQALWHTRLILMLRGAEVRSITYVSPDRDQAKQLIATVSAENSARWKANCSFEFIDNNSPDFQQKLQARLGNVDCIFCTTPSKKPLFPASYISNRGSRRPLISAIGSWQSDMIELDPELLRLAVQPNAGYNPLTGKDDGVILVDDRDFALTNSGELVKSRTKAGDVVELGEILTLKSENLSSVSTTKMAVEKTDRFVSEGLVIYKSVGVSLTDLTVSDAILRLAKKRQQKL